MNTRVTESIRNVNEQNMAFRLIHGIRNAQRREITCKTANYTLLQAWYIELNNRYGL